MASVYDSERLATAYAFDRPPVHEQILRSVRLARQADQALDVGCGAGLSTAALAPLARRVIGLEPVPAIGLQLLDFTDMEARLPMDVDAYLRYALSETNVENSIASGACGQEEARDWCQTTLEPVFADGPVTVVISGHVATLARAAEFE